MKKSTSIAFAALLTAAAVLPGAAAAQVPPQKPIAVFNETIALFAAFNHAVRTGLSTQAEFDQLAQKFDAAGRPEMSFLLGLLFPGLAQGNPGVYARITAPPPAPPAKREVPDDPVNGGGSRGGETAALGDIAGACGLTVEHVKALPQGWTNRPPSGAAVYGRWSARYGVSRDTVYIPADTWGFLVRGVPVWGVLLSVGGTAAFERGDGAPASTNLLSALGGDFSLVPDMGGAFWWYVTGSNTVVFTWENAFLNRDPAFPATIQLELWDNGDFAYRYALLGGDAAAYGPVLAGFRLGVTLGGLGGNAALGGITAPIGGDPAASLLDFITGNPGGVEIRFKRPTPAPDIYISPGPFEFPDEWAVLFELIGVEYLDGTVAWYYGNQVLHGNPVHIAPDWVNKPDSLTAVFTPTHTNGVQKALKRTVTFKPRYMGGAAKLSTDPPEQTHTNDVYTTITESTAITYDPPEEEEEGGKPPDPPQDGPSIEFLAADGTVTNFLCVAKWEGAFKEDSSGVSFKTPDFINGDADRFRVRLSDDRRTEDTLEVAVSQSGSLGGSRTVTLYCQTDGIYLSTNLLLVADAEDRNDAALTAIGAAPGINQRMFQTALDDTLSASYTYNDDTISSTATVGVDVKTLTVDVAVMTVNGKLCADGLQLEASLRETRERLAPANIRVVINSDVYFAPPLSIAANPTDWSACTLHSSGVRQMTQEARDVIINTCLDLGNDRIRVIYVPKGIKDANGQLVQGIAFFDWISQAIPADVEFIDTCFVTAVAGEHYVVPHEIAHLLGVEHLLGVSWNLMEPWLIVRNGINCTKRLTQEQVDDMRADGIKRNKLK